MSVYEVNICIYIYIYACHLHCIFYIYIYISMIYLWFDTSFIYACVGKSSWPELVGVQGTVAEATIERENSYVDAVIVPEGSSVILDFRCDRVWVWVDKNGIVYRVPTIG